MYIHYLITMRSYMVLRCGVVELFGVDNLHDLVWERLA